MKSSAKKPEEKETPSNSGKVEERNKKVEFVRADRDKDKAPSTGELIWLIHRCSLIIPLDYEQWYHRVTILEGSCIMCKDLTLPSFIFFFFE